LLQNTNVVGPLPKSFVPLPSLAVLDLSFNQLNGSQPLFEITKLVSLPALDLTHNQLSGPFPYTISQLSSLAILFLSSNNLSGVINETHLSNLSKLKYLDISSNSLSFNLSSHWIPPFKCVHPIMSFSLKLNLKGRSQVFLPLSLLAFQ